jgi:hypothetical protein
MPPGMLTIRLSSPRLSAITHPAVIIKLAAAAASSVPRGLSTAGALTSSPNRVSILPRHDPAGQREDVWK